MANPLEDMMKQLKSVTGQEERQLVPELQDTLIGRPVEELDQEPVSEEVQEEINDVVESPYIEEKPETKPSLEQELYGQDGIDPILNKAFADAQDATKEDTPLTRQESLLEELRKIRGDSRKELQQAREDENRRKLIAGLGSNLAQYMVGSQQSDSGANIKMPEYRGIDPKSIDLTSDVMQKRKEDLEAALQEYKLLAPAKRDIRQIGNRLVEVTPEGEAKTLLDAPAADDKSKMTEYQRAMLDLKKAELDKKQELPRLTKAQEKVDVEFAKDYNEFVNRGGSADIEKNLSQLDEAIDELKKSDKLTGPVVGSVPKFARDIVNPKSSAIQEAVEEVVQRNLRLVLGAQFTEKEGERLISRAYNPRLSEAENIKRLNRLSKQIGDAAKAKERAGKYYEKHGSLKGFKGLPPKSANEFLSDVKDESSKKDSKIQEYAKKYKLDYDKAEQILRRRGYGG